MSKQSQRIGSEQRVRLACRLEAALADVGGAPCAGESVLFAELVERYAQPQRHYHTLVHVDACLTWLDWFAGSAEPQSERDGRAERAEIELALWFHDVVYDPQCTDNEQASAELARSHLVAAGVRAPSIARVVDHVLATRSHTAETNAAALVIDVDLAILAASPGEYACFEQQIRSEYLYVPEQLYRQARAAVLREFLARPRIYHTLSVRELLEQRARHNLEQAIVRLGQ